MRVTRFIRWCLVSLTMALSIAIVHPTTASADTEKVYLPASLQDATSFSLPEGPSQVLSAEGFLIREQAGCSTFRLLDCTWTAADHVSCPEAKCGPYVGQWVKITYMAVLVCDPLPGMAPIPSALFMGPDGTIALDEQPCGQPNQPTLCPTSIPPTSTSTSVVPTQTPVWTSTPTAVPTSSTPTPVATSCPAPLPGCYDKELHEDEIWTVPATASQPWGSKGDIEVFVPGAENVVFYDGGPNSGDTGTVVIFESNEGVIGPCNGANLICLFNRGCGSVEAGIRSLIVEELNANGACGSPTGCRWVHVFRVRGSTIVEDWWEDDTGRVGAPSGVNWPPSWDERCDWRPRPLHTREFTAI